MALILGLARDVLGGAAAKALRAAAAALDGWDQLADLDRALAAGGALSAALCRESARHAETVRARSELYRELEAVRAGHADVAAAWRARVARAERARDDLRVELDEARAELTTVSAGVEELAGKLAALDEAVKAERAAGEEQRGRLRGERDSLREVVDAERAGAEALRLQYHADVARLEAEAADLREKLLRAEVTCVQAARTASAVAQLSAYEPGGD